jgi:hypothetical protein
LNRVVAGKRSQPIVREQSHGFTESAELVPRTSRTTRTAGV